jgi:hypothetical protein
MIEVLVDAVENIAAAASDDFVHILGLICATFGKAENAFLSQIAFSSTDTFIIIMASSRPCGTKINHLQV